MKTILLIEDNLELRENTAEILELSGYKVWTAENGKIGVELAQSKAPDIIICDIMMPVLDGFGVLHILSRKVETAAIPFIFLTAKAEKSDIRSGMQLGADDYITKPFQELDLLETIERRIKRVENIRKVHSSDPSEKLHGFYNQAKGVKKLESLSDEREIITYQNKQLLFAEGGYPHKLFYIQKGRVKTYRSNDDAKELITNIFHAGDFVGIHALLNNEAYKESAMALDETEIAVIPTKDFFTLLYNDRDVAHHFIKMMSNNINEKEERLLNLAYNSVRRRLADTLVDLFKKADSNEIQLSRENLANIVGTSKETLIRTLSDFKSEKLISIEQNKIILLNEKKLMFIIG